MESLPFLETGLNSNRIMSPYKLEPRSAASTSSSLSYTHAVKSSDSDYH